MITGCVPRNEESGQEFSTLSVEKDNGATISSGQEMSQQEFSTLADEEDFWGDWLEKHRGGLEFDLHFFLEYISAKQIDEELNAIAKQATSFVLIVETCTNSWFFEITAVAKTNDRWELTKWALETRDGMDVMVKSVVESPQIDEDSVKTLSESPVSFIPLPGAVDAEAVLMFVRHSDKFSRHAIYVPWQLMREEKGTLTPVASAMKSLFLCIGLLEED